MWTWDEEHEDGALSVPFATWREAMWAARLIGSSYADGVDIRVGATMSRFLSIGVELGSPDSYSDEWEEMERDPDGYRARTQAAIARAKAKVDDEIARLGITPAPYQPFSPEVEQRITDTRTRLGRAMPPTRRAVRAAVTISEATPTGYRAERQTIDASTVFCNYLTGEAIPPVPLLVGETYWMTGNGPIVATVDVADVEPGAESALAGMLHDVDLRAFLARELQYGPLDLARARSLLLRDWLDKRHALSLEAGPVAVANSQTLLDRRLGPATWTPWPEDARIVLRAPESGGE